jgi:hypothetical protein
MSLTHTLDLRRVKVYMRECRYTQHILKGTSRRLCPRAKHYWHALRRELVGPENRCGRFGEYKNLFLDAHRTQIAQPKRIDKRDSGCQIFKWIFKKRIFRNTEYDCSVVCFTMKMTGPRSFEASISIYRMIKQHVVTSKTTWILWLQLSASRHCVCEAHLRIKPFAVVFRFSVHKLMFLGRSELELRLLNMY